MLKRIVVFLVVPAAVLFGCGSDGSSHNQNQTTAGSATDGSTGGTTDNAEIEGVDTYVANLVKAGINGHFSVKLVESLPIPKDIEIYTWRVQVLFKSEEPVVGASVIAEPVMPAHGHGTVPRFTVGKSVDESGNYELVDMDLYMPGVWEITVRIESDNLKDEAVFNFNLDG